MKLLLLAVILLLLTPSVFASDNLSFRVIDAVTGKSIENVDIIYSPLTFNKTQHPSLVFKCYEGYEIGVQNLVALSIPGYPTSITYVIAKGSGDNLNDVRVYPNDQLVKINLTIPSVASGCIVNTTSLLDGPRDVAATGCSVKTSLDSVGRGFTSLSVSPDVGHYVLVSLAIPGTYVGKYIPLCKPKSVVNTTLDFSGVFVTPGRGADILITTGRKQPPLLTAMLVPKGKTEKDVVLVSNMFSNREARAAFRSIAPGSYYLKVCASGGALVWSLDVTVSAGDKVSLIVP